jgi:hypothetical protein
MAGCREDGAVPRRLAGSAGDDGIVARRKTEENRSARQTAPEE